MRAIGVRRKVERAAIELFAERGVDGASIAEIAEAAGVAQGALYRHYPSKDELAWSMFSAAYLGAGAELDEIGAREPDFRSRIAAMIAHFCTLYDSDPALFRFMLLSQHGLLPRIKPEQRTPIDAIRDAVAEAVRTGEIAPLEAPLGAAAIVGVVLQTATFHIYGQLRGPLAARVQGLARAAVAAAKALGSASV